MNYQLSLYTLIKLLVLLAVLISISINTVLASSSDIPELSITYSHTIQKNSSGILSGVSSRIFNAETIDSIGDLDGDGNEDLVIGSPVDSSAGSGKGAIWVVFLNADATVKGYKKIYSGANGFDGNPINSFGAAVTNIGDVDNDGVTDIAVSAPHAGASSISTTENTLWVLFMRNDGSVKSYQKIGNNSGGFLGMMPSYTGESIQGVGDLNNDGVPDMAAGETSEGIGAGSVTIFFLNNDGTIKTTTGFSLADRINPLFQNQDRFGSAIDSLGDIDSDGVTDLAVTAPGDQDTKPEGGAVWVIRMNSNGTIKASNKISVDNGGDQIPVGLGSSVENIGDINNDGINDIAVGAGSAGQQVDYAGLVWFFTLNSDGTTKTEESIRNWIDIPKIFPKQIGFGRSLASINDNSNSERKLLAGVFLNMNQTEPVVIDSGFMVLKATSVQTNISPVLNLIGNQNTSENQNLSFTTTATDTPNSVLFYAATGLPNGATYNAQTGEFSWTPTFDQAGTYPVTFTVSDGDLTDSETINIVVTNVNRAPILNQIGNQVINENNQLSFTVSASDADGDAVVLLASNLPPGATFTNGTFSWTPTFTQAGNYENIEFVASDNGSPLELDVELITITVGDVNRAPELSNPGPQSVIEGQAVTFTVTASDPDNDEVVLTISGMPNGATFNSASGNFAWTPTNTQSGNYTLTITATDNGSPVESGSVDVVITVGDNPTPIEQSQNIINVIISYNLPNNVMNSYMANLQKVEPFITNGQIQPAINQLNSFINKVNNDYSKGKITLAQKNQLVNMAQQLILDLQ